MKFYLGTHVTKWLSILDIPLFVSRRQLDGIRKLPRAKCGWALDSGAFSELSLYGKWQTSVNQYITLVKRFSDEIGNLDFAAPMDWMCEPFILKKTGLTVQQHQLNTVLNYLELKTSAPELPWIPVLQGWTLQDYLSIVDLYLSNGVDLSLEKRVGLGSVCRRQSTSEVAEIVSVLHKQGIKLHGFGIKLGGIAKIGDKLKSSDSLAWSFGARRLGVNWCGKSGHKNCANCIIYALYWREKILEVLDKKTSIEGLLKTKDGVIFKPLFKLTSSVDIDKLLKL